MWGLVFFSIVASFHLLNMWLKLMQVGTKFCPIQLYALHFAHQSSCKLQWELMIRRSNIWHHLLIKNFNLLHSVCFKLLVISSTFFIWSWPKMFVNLSKVASLLVSFKMFFLMLRNFRWNWNHEASIVVAIPNALCETHFEKIRITSENKIIVIQISTRMFNSWPTLGLQVHKNKSGKYPNSCKFLHLDTSIHTFFCKLCTFNTLYMHDVYLYFAKYRFHGCKCWREIWEGKFELKQEKCFKCTLIFSFDIQTEIRKLKMGRVMKDASLTSFLQMVGQRSLCPKVEKIRWCWRDLQTRLKETWKED